MKRIYIITLIISFFLASSVFAQDKWKAIGSKKTDMVTNHYFIKNVQRKHGEIHFLSSIVSDPKSQKEINERFKPMPGTLYGDGPPRKTTFHTAPASYKVINKKEKVNCRDKTFEIMHVKEFNKDNECTREDIKKPGSYVKKVSKSNFAEHYILSKYCR